VDRESECRLGGDVDQVGSEALDGISDPSVGWDRQVEVWVEGDAERRDWIALYRVGRLAVVGVDYLNGIPPLFQDAD
jgi:hypothetical protein